MENEPIYPSVLSENQPENCPELAAAPVLEEYVEQPPSPPHRRRLHFRWLFTGKNAARTVWALGPWCTLFMVEILNNNSILKSLSCEQVVLNLLWYYLIFWVFRMILGRRLLSAGFAAAVCFLLGLANHYVLTFRGRIIFPCDLLSLGTAANVAKNYDYTPDRSVWIAAALLGGYWLLLALVRLFYRARGRQKLRRRTALASWICISAFVYAFFFTPLLPTIGIYTQQWKTQANGFLLNFMTALRYSFVSAPEGYSHDAAQAIADSITPLPAAEGVDPPENLIVIMNESFADMTASFPNLELTEDPLPFFHALTENTVKGWMVSPVTGGGTANVEFEYLTGDSLAFLPSSTVAYQLYLYDGAPSLVSQAGQLGYASFAFHPYLASGWNRTSVYPWLGFDTQWYEDDVRSPRLIRDFISDSSDYEQVYRITDEAQGNTFVFNVTMQNHSGYALGWKNLERTVETVGDLPGSANGYAQYFSLMKESDNALRELIEHYSACDKRTMIVFFGDHQPPLGNELYQTLYGKALDDRTTAEVIQAYEVPFFIWANYDLPAQSGVRLSSNFLGVLTAELAGFPLTGYQTLLHNLMAELPVATTIGFVTADGTVTDDETSLPPQAQQLYQQYRLMAYNHLFDKSHHPKGFYG